MLHYVRGFAALGMLAGISLLANACGTGEFLFDEEGQQICSEDCDCMMPTLRCDSSNRCTCPIVGQRFCNRKGHTEGNFEAGCYIDKECEPGELGVPEGDPPPPPECTDTDLSKCPGPPDKRCGSATCIDGACAVKIVPGPIASQKAGDCEKSICDSAGSVVKVEDPSDYYNDGAECTFDMCNGSSSEALEILKIVCPNKGEDFCSEGKCVQCIDKYDCGAAEDCSFGRCVPNTCSNNMMDSPGESDEDCGGVCLPCNSGKACAGNSDCKSNVCKNNQCQEPNCNDNEKNDGETDKDCGAACNDLAKLCGTGQGCKTGSDCESSVCWAAKCLAPTCFDGVQNDKETGIDCGGDCSKC